MANNARTIMESNRLIDCKLEEKVNLGASKDAYMLFFLSSLLICVCLICLCYFGTWVFRICYSLMPTIL